MKKIEVHRSFSLYQCAVFNYVRKHAKCASKQIVICQIICL